MVATEVDVCVVGSGAGGASVAYSLAKAGARVVVLEKGAEYHRSPDDVPDELEWRELSPPRREDEPLVFEHPDGTTELVDRWWAIETVGGSSTVWHAHMHRMTPPDFRRRELLGPIAGADLVDWPFSYSDFLPYYAEAERLLGVAGDAVSAAVPEHLPAGYRYPQGPFPPHPSARVLGAAAQRLGLHVYPTPYAINHQPYDGRPPCLDCGWCQFFLCPVDSRASAKQLIRKAVQTGQCEVRTRCQAVQITLDRSTRRARGVVYVNESGALVEQRARIIVLACGAIETARLALVSEIPNDNGLIGRYLTFHTTGWGYGLLLGRPRWEARPGEQMTLGTVTVRNWSQSDELPQQLGGVLHFFDPYWSLSPIELAKRVPGWGQDWVRTLVMLRHAPGLAFTFHGESLPRYENCVMLDPHRRDAVGMPLARIRHEPHPLDLELSAWAVSEGARILAEAGVDPQACILQPQTGPLKGYSHQHGTCRAGKDPESSVVDPFCRFHAVPNLFVTDGSWMPTSGSCNPGLTIVANALRVADAIIENRYKWF